MRQKSNYVHQSHAISAVTITRGTCRGSAIADGNTWVLLWHAAMAAAVVSIYSLAFTITPNGTYLQYTGTRVQGARTCYLTDHPHCPRSLPVSVPTVALAARPQYRPDDCIRAKSISAY